MVHDELEDNGNTYSCESIYPSRNSLPSELEAHVFTEMIAVLNDQVIHITMIACRLTLDEISDLDRIQACCPHKYGLPELKARTLSRFNFKHAT